MAIDQINSENDDDTTGIWGAMKSFWARLRKQLDPDQPGIAQKVELVEALLGRRITGINIEDAPLIINGQVTTIRRQDAEIEKFSSPDEIAQLKENAAWITRWEASGRHMPTLGSDPLTNSQEAFRALRDGDNLEKSKPFYVNDPNEIADIIRASLKEAGKDASVLFPAGEKTPEEAEKEITRMTEERYVVIARADFKALQAGLRLPSQSGIGNDEDPHTAAALIREDLKLAHKDASVLDLSGKRTAAEMEKQIDFGVVAKTDITETERKKYIELARLDFQIMTDFATIGSSDESYNHLHAMLKRAGVDASVLDPEGKRSAKQMDDLLEQTHKQTLISTARTELGGIEFGMGHDDKDIRQNLAKAGVTMAALDPSGKRSDAEMEAILQDDLRASKAEHERLNHMDMSYSMTGGGLTLVEWEKKNSGVKTGAAIEGGASVTTDNVMHGLGVTNGGPQTSAKIISQ